MLQIDTLAEWIAAAACVGGAGLGALWADRPGLGGQSGALARR
jgi:hypothetical protein